MTTDNFIHFSIDDVWRSFRYISNNKPNSIFDLNLYGQLLQWHKKYGLKVTLYLIACSEDYLISEIPEKYKSDFADNKDWLRFGFHSKSKLSFREDSGYKAGYELVQSTIKKMNMGETDTLRLHSWFCSAEQKAFLYDEGIKTIFYPDDDCLKYDKNDLFLDCGLIHRRTRCWVEKMDHIDEEHCFVDKEYVSVFTHEWCFDEQKDKIECLLEIYKKAGFSFL
ncbi:MAG: hypothetical protein K6E79_06535 [Pseudobutyrivibrio sp.]|nr:hypothetical protein [Pseudobutyrivibrio sp.]